MELKCVTCKEVKPVEEIKTCFVCEEWVCNKCAVNIGNAYEVCSRCNKFEEGENEN